MIPVDSRGRAVIAGLLALVLLAAGCGNRSGDDSGLSGDVRIDGSSTVYPITEAVAEEFGKRFAAVDVKVGRSGTGGGFKRFTKGETDVSNASRPIMNQEDGAARAGRVEYVELPIALDGLSFVVNRANDWVDHLTVDELRRIFLHGSTVSSWKDVRSSFPDVPLKIYAPGTDSGSFDYFKLVIADKTGSIRSDISVSEDDNVLVRGVSGEKGGLGFFGYAYYSENKDKLRVVPIDGGQGPIRPSPKTIADGTYSPFTRPLFIYVNAAAIQKPHVKEFIAFYLDEGPALVESVGYVRLPQSIYAKARENVDRRRTGSFFLDAEGEIRRGSVTNIYQ